MVAEFAGCCEDMTASTVHVTLSVILLYLASDRFVYFPWKGSCRRHHHLLRARVDHGHQGYRFTSGLLLPSL